ncbi:MAG: hypothetical protein O3B01_02940 [Planctomycetota bacterium]|nr:hypothetical protein [Planctomycetota bacterium]MDA1137515.1 hypothetical protein [Planctomycetota bacterium]
MSIRNGYTITILACLLFTGCGSNKQTEVDSAGALKLVQSHVEENKERLHLQWVEKYPPGVKATPLEGDGTFSHECRIFVFSGPMAMPNSGKPARRTGYYVVKFRRDTGEWEITSGEVPMDIQLKRM